MSVTRTVFASPIFWAMSAAYLAGALTFGTTGDDPMPPNWKVCAVGFVIAGVAHALERWYVTARAKAMAERGIRDAARIRPDLFR